MDKTRQRLEKALDEDPSNQALRGVLADFVEEHPENDDDLVYARGMRWLILDRSYPRETVDHYWRWFLRKDGEWPQYLHGDAYLRVEVFDKLDGIKEVNVNVGMDFDSLAEPVLQEWTTEYSRTYRTRRLAEMAVGRVVS